MVLNTVASALIGDTQGRSTQRRRQWDHGGRYWGDIATSHGTARAPRCWKRQDTDHLLQPSRGHGPTNTLISDFGPPELCKHEFLMFPATKFMVICYRSHKKLINTHFTNMRMKPRRANQLT